MSLVYLDSSALVKLVVREPESTALVAFLHGHAERVSSALALSEVPRALRRAGFGASERRRARQVLSRVVLIESTVGPWRPRPRWIHRRSAPWTRSISRQR